MTSRRCALSCSHVVGQFLSGAVSRVFVSGTISSSSLLLQIIINIFCVYDSEERNIIDLFPLNTWL